MTRRSGEPRTARACAGPARCSEPPSQIGTATSSLLIGEDDLIVEQFTATGTQHGEIMGVPANGRTVTLRGIQIFRLREGRIVERWGRLDDLGLLSQLGLANQP